MFCLLWTDIGRDCEIQSGVFNVIMTRLDNIYDHQIKRERTQLISALLKAFGMKLIESPVKILRELEKASIKCSTSIPESVWTFLKYFEGLSNNVGHANSKIEETVYKSIHNFLVFTNFLSLDKDYVQKIEGLSLLLTADGILRAASQGNTVFSSRFFKLLPAAENRFIHESLRDIFSDNCLNCLFEMNSIRKLEFDDFCDLLPYSISPNEFRSRHEVPLNGDNYGSLSSEWICLLFDFLCENSRRTQLETTSSASHFEYLTFDTPIELDRLMSYIEKLHEWSFLPATKMGINCLVPFTECTNLLHLSQAQKCDKLGEALMKLNIPGLDTKILNKCSNSLLVLSAMPQCVASSDQPAKLLSCLAFHRRQGGKYATLLDSEALEILSYFSKNLLSLTKSEVSELITKQLKQLPLYKTLQNTLSSIENDADVFVLPRGMPSAGIEEWAANTNTTLLIEIDSLQNLFNFLGLHSSGVECIYADKILPTLHKMPNHCWMRHIAYLKNKLGHLSCFSETQSKIITALTNIAFVNISGVMKPVNQLYDPENKVFACMKAPTDFPPPEQFDFTWKQFLKHLGLISYVDDEHFLEFAREIEDSGNVYIDERLKEKWLALLECFVQNEGTRWKILSRLALVRFILPYKVSSKQSSIFPQKDNARKLVCFHHAVSSEHANLSWSCVDLIPSWIYEALHPNVRSELEMYNEPPMEKVLLHCQNVVDCLKQFLLSGKISAEFVIEQMTHFYEHFNKHMQLISLMKSRLQHKPIIHLPGDNDLVTVNEIVIDLNSDKEIKPYLFKAPKFYGKFHGLFEHLGSKTDIMFSHYARILYNIKSKSCEEELTPPERLVVKKVLNGILTLEFDNDDSITDIKTLYLPNENLVLKDASTIVFSNNVWFLHRIRDHLQALDLFVGPAFLELSVDVDLQALLRKLPKHLRPIMLTDLVKETVRIEKEIRHTNKYSVKALKLESFLHSKQFITCICRLLKHQLFTRAKSFDRSMIESNITTRMKSINVRETSSLVSVMTYQGNPIPGSEIGIECHVTESEDGFTLYFKDTNDSDKIDIVSIQHALLSTLCRCVPDLKSDSVTHLTLLLQSVEHPDQLSLILDKLNITPYDFREADRRDYFPEPGTRVEECMIPFLEPGIIPFKEYEFESVALELDDNLMDDERSQTFIYVRILKEGTPRNTSSDLKQKYIVKTGNPDLNSEIIPIYRLYRFVRRENNTGKKLQRYDEKPFDFRPLDEQCCGIRHDLIEAWKLPEADRKRVIRRLLLKWHPDKHRGNEQYCTNVYHYIRIIISRLENGEVVDNIEEAMARGPSQVSQGTSTYYDNVDRRAQNIARAYYDNWDEYNRAERTGHYSHASAAKMKVPDIVEANRWLRQAKNDYKAASVMLPSASDVDGFNWVCYTCHQSCEKALKAVLYSKDANNVPSGSRSHNLVGLTSDPDMQEQAMLLENRVGQNARMRYPDTTYTKEDAEFSVKIAKRMIELAEEYVLDV